MTSTLPIQQPSLRSAQRSDTDLPMASTFARTLRSFAEREQLDLTETLLSPAPAPPVKRAQRPVGAPLTTGVSIAKKEVKPQEPEQPVQELEAIKAPEQPLRGGLLIRGLAWLKKNNKFAAVKQLRVAETISLGEKRFVSVIHVDGQKFLIGGGSSGVTLLTQLGAAQAAADALQTIANAGEQLK